MKPWRTALFPIFLFLTVSLVWAEYEPGPDFPAYEPPQIEDIPSVIAPSTPEETSPVEVPMSEPSPVAPPQAEATPTPVMQPYRVWIWQENGDSLSMIAKKVYGDPQKWNLIYLANKDVIKDPNKIYPKQTLKIPPADWIPDTGF